MLEMLLRLLGLKRRRRRVYAQSPLPPGAGQPPRRLGRPSMPAPPGLSQNLRRDAELQNEKLAQQLLRARGQRGASPLAAIPVIGGWFKPRRVRAGVAMPARPGETQIRRTGEGDTPQPGKATAKARRPRKTLRQIMREIVAEIGASWTGPVGRFTRRTAWVLLVYVAPAAAVGIPVYFTVQEMRLIGVEVAPITVPADVARTGRTPDVLAQLLIDQIDATRREILLDRTDRWPQDISARLPPFAPASQADTLRQMALWVRSMIARPVPTISGAVTERPDGKLSLRLYMTGMNRGAPVAALEGFDAEDLNRVVAGAAPLMVRATTPRLYAWFLASREQRPDVLQAGLHGLLTDPASGTVDPGTRDTVDFLIARNLARTGRADEALALSDDIIKRAPRYAPAFYAKALALEAHGDADEAVAAVEEARRLDAGSAWSYKATARVLLNTGKVADALADIRVARRLDPNDGSAIIIEAEDLLLMRRVEEAAAAVRVGLERAPGQPGILEAAAGVMLARGRPDIAIGLINNELRQRPDRVSALITKARLMSAVGHGAEALQAADAALRLQPTNGVAQTARAYALVAVSRPREGLALFDKLVESARDNPTVLQGRGLALAELGRKDEAIAEFKRALDLMPDFIGARRELDKLQGRTPAPLLQPANATAQNQSAAPAPPPAAPKRSAGDFTAAPIDVGPAPAPAIPHTETGLLPGAPGTFTNQRRNPNAVFRRPDSE